MKKKTNIITIIILIVVSILIVATIIIYKDKGYEIVDNNAGQFAFYYQTENGEYEESSENKWIEGDYALNLENSSCNGEKKPDFLNWNKESHSVVLTRNKDTKCSLYFDIDKTFILLSAYPITGRDVQLTNMVKNGSFEDGNNNWTIGNAEIVTDEYSHGAHSIKFGYNTSIQRYGSHVTQYLDVKAPTLNHSYYGRLMFLSNDKFAVGDARYEWYYSDESREISTLVFAVKNLKVQEWTLISNVTTLKSDKYVSNQWVLRNFVVDPNDYSYLDGIMLIDLTASYGDDIPTQQELDNTLVYFDGTVDMKTITGKEGVFNVEGASANMDIECDNGGSATVQNGIVTIKGDSSKTTCYLKGTYNFEYKPEIQKFVVPVTGTYNLEVWGAQGGTGNSTEKGGLGGYSTGTIDLSKGDTLYIAVGGQGNNTFESNIAKGGYNGGGNGYLSSGQSGFGGGGATHIAKSSGLLKELVNKQNDILIVAGGGGGNGNTTNNAYPPNGGVGGGLTGGNGFNGTGQSNYLGHGGTQSSFGECANELTNSCGAFGQGGNAANQTIGSSGGGGGFYGGSQSTRGHAGGGGGSGYINSSLKDAKTIAGDQSFPNPKGGEETGHAGNGYARITLIS